MMKIPAQHGHRATAAAQHSVLDLDPLIRHLIRRCWALPYAGTACGFTPLVTAAYLRWAGGVINGS